MSRAISTARRPAARAVRRRSGVLAPVGDAIERRAGEAEAEARAAVLKKASFMLHPSLAAPALAKRRKARLNRARISQATV